MGEQRQPIYQVCPQPDCVFAKITGRASYLNCGPFRQFLHDMLGAGHNRFVLDFADCTGADSTLLGILVGVALTLRGQEPAGSMTLLRLCENNLETVRNLGIHRIVEVRSSDEIPDPSGNEEPLEDVPGTGAKGEAVQAKEVYEAHRRLIELNENNARKFQDVVTFLKENLEGEDE